MENNNCCCSHKTKERSEAEYKKLVNRLNRIEGQIRGIKGMLEKRCLLYRYSDSGVCGECGTEWILKRVAGESYPNMCGR